jgi:hypothetical protein
MARTLFDCPESGEKCNRLDCSIKSCADRKALGAREKERARAPREKEVERPDWEMTFAIKKIMDDSPPQPRPRIARRSKMR